MEGIEKREGRPKPFLVRWREPGTKKLKARAFRKEEEATAWRDQVRQDIRYDTYQPTEPLPFDKWAEGWLKRKRPLVGPNTGAFYEWAVNRLVAEFGTMPLQNLRPDRIETWQAKMLSESGLSGRSVRSLRLALRGILADAWQKDYLRKNPMEKVAGFKVSSRELRYLTVDQLGALCLKVGPLHGVLFLTLALCGLRIGEALGLQWRDLALDSQRLHIQRQVIWRRQRDCKAGEPRWAFAPPKSEAGDRTVEIPPDLVPFLGAHRERQNGGLNPHGLVFCTKQGPPLDGRNVRRRHFEPALKRLGLTGVRLHDFRRTFIALHVRAGTHPKLVQDRVGHKDIRLTMDTYGKIAGKVALGPEEASRFNGLTAKALPPLVNIGEHEDQKQPGTDRRRLEAEVA